MRRLAEFTKTTLIGGVLVVLPVWLTILLVAKSLAALAALIAPVSATLPPALQFRVNGEVFRFASERTLKKFMLAPTRWCGVVRDPVSGRTFQPTTFSPEAYWIGGPYYFESDSTKARFVDDPHRYEIIRRM